MEDSLEKEKRFAHVLSVNPWSVVECIPFAQVPKLIWYKSKSRVFVFFNDSRKIDS